MQTHAVISIPGVPPNWSNQRLSTFARHAAMKDWSILANRLAHGARNTARWPVAMKIDPPTPRWVVFSLYRHHLLDDDGAWSSIKPLIDGLKGALIWDDAPAWCRIMPCPPPSGQVITQGPEHCELVVHLLQPTAEVITSTMAV